MKCDIQLKVEIDYSIYSKPLRLGCPFCKFNTSHKTRTFNSMKSLLYHLSNEHKQNENLHPFTIADVKSLMQALAKSVEVGLVV
ncbi:MAG: hypothetical protein IIC67_10910 [Thaumarchaeota archaeon]|nr:hypothetical protein [Nitrososphaerota archaeon]